MILYDDVGDVKMFNYRYDIEEEIFLLFFSFYVLFYHILSFPFIFFLFLS